MEDSRLRRRYLKLMWEVDKRLEALHTLMNNQTNIPYLQITIESEALQLRKLLEIIAYSSLIAHKTGYEKLREGVSKDWHAKRIIRKIEEINPDFYPTPMTRTENRGWKRRNGGFLTKTQFETLYDKCGDMMHTKNPFSKRSPNSLRFHERVPDYVERIENLIRSHQVKLAGVEKLIFVNVPLFVNKPIQMTVLEKAN